MKNLKTASYKIRVTPEQSEHVQKICFSHDIPWLFGEKKLNGTEQGELFITEERIMSSSFKNECTRISYQDFVKKYEGKNWVGRGLELSYSIDSATFSIEKKPKKVLVRDNCHKNWEERYFISELPGNVKNRFICVEQDDEEAFLKEEEYEIEYWQQMKEIKEPKKMPYDVESILKGAFVWIRKKGEKEVLAIQAISEFEVYVSGDYFKLKDVDDYEIAKAGGDFEPFYQTK